VARALSLERRKLD